MALLQSSYLLWVYEQWIADMQIGSFTFSGSFTSIFEASGTWVLDLPASDDNCSGTWIARFDNSF